MATHLNATDARTVTVLFGVNLTARRGDDVGARPLPGPDEGLPRDDLAEVELAQFERERRGAVALQAVSTGVAVFLRVLAVVVFLGVALLLLLEPLWRMRRPPVRQTGSGRTTTGGTR